MGGACGAVAGVGARIVGEGGLDCAWIVVIAGGVYVRVAVGAASADEGLG